MKSCLQNWHFLPHSVCLLLSFNSLAQVSIFYRSSSSGYISCIAQEKSRDLNMGKDPKAIPWCTSREFFYLVDEDMKQQLSQAEQHSWSHVTWEACGNGSTDGFLSEKLSFCQPACWNLQSNLQTHVSYVWIFPLKQNCRIK